jgi:hypothetical protein
MIDGDPQEVRLGTIAQIMVVAARVEDLAKDSEIMLRNSHMSRILRQAPATTADELTEKWETSDEAGRAARLVGAAETLSACANQLQKGATNGGS